MKDILVLTILVSTFTTFSLAQDKTEPRVIEVSGSAERLVTPDTFTFKITVIERLEKKEKLTIEQQESTLRTELQKIGIDANKDLSVYDISAAYNLRKRVRDVMGAKDYRLKVRDINKISPLITAIDTLNIGRLELMDTEHSEITRLRRETKMDAIKAAKEKADYLLSAINERAGKTVWVKEIDEETPRAASGYNYGSNVVANISRGVVSGRSDDDDSLSFSPIRLRYVIQAKFEIE
ncbi:MAG: SIMPL domain-containing protein [Pyrinomonadaceae bacterium]